MIEHILRLDEESGGFGRILVQATKWATREQVLHSYELIARHVMPRFQGSVTSLVESNAWTAERRSEPAGLVTKAVDRAREDYLESRAGS